MDFKKVANNMNNIAGKTGKFVTFLTFTAIICDFIGNKQSKNQSNNVLPKK